MMVRELACWDERIKGEDNGFKKQFPESIIYKESLYLKIWDKEKNRSKRWSPYGNSWN